MISEIYINSRHPLFKYQTLFESMANSNEIEAIFQAKPEIDVSHAGGRAVLYNPENGSATVLNPAGSVLWGKLTESAYTVDSLAAALGEVFEEIDKETATADTEKFLQELVASSLVQVSTQKPDACG